MKRKKPKGRLLMTLGLMCIVCAGGMAGHILLTEHRSDLAAQTVLTELNQQIPHNTPAPTEEAPRLVITDQSGNQVDWPMAAQDVPMPWPVNSAGAPVATVTDAFGQTFVWQYDLNRPCIANGEQVSAQGVVSHPGDDVTSTDAPAYSGDNSPIVTDAPAFSGDSTSAATDAPAYSGDNSSAATSTPAFSGDNPSAVTDAPAYSADAMSAVTSTPAFSADATSAATDAPTYSADAMSAATNIPTHSGDTTPAATDAPAYSGDNPSAMTDAPAYLVDYTSAATNSPAHSGDTTSAATNSPAPAQTAGTVSAVSDAPSPSPFPALPQTDDTRPTAAPTVSVVSSAWTQNSQGGLLPYVSDGHGQVIPWMTDTAGQAVTEELLQGLWQTLLTQMSLNLSELREQPAFVRNPRMEMPITTLDGHEYIGIVDIPSQGLSLPIMSEWSYPKLKIAPCRFSGSVYAGDIVIAGHNSNGHFTRIKKLVIGDEVRFTDVDGNVFRYSVIGIDVVGANDVDDMLAGADVWDLTLFTCSYSARKRTAIRCKLEGYQLPEEVK